VLTDSIDYLSADLTASYDGRVRDYRRDFVFLKPDVLIVRDRLKADGPHTFSWLLHAPPGTATQVEGARLSIKGQKASALLTAIGTNTNWKEVAAPIPAELFTDLDHKKIPPRSEFILDSARAPSADFLVGMQFVQTSASNGPRLETYKQQAGEGFRQAGSRNTDIAFRTGPGTLHAGPLTSDGDILAFNDPGDRRSWLAAGAHRVQQDQQLVLTASASVDAAEAIAPDGMTVHLYNTISARVAIFDGAKPRSVEVDGHAVSFGYENRMVTLSALQPGEHRVSIH